MTRAAVASFSGATVARGIGMFRKRTWEARCYSINAVDWKEPSALFWNQNKARIIKESTNWPPYNPLLLVQSYGVANAERIEGIDGWHQMKVTLEVATRSGPPPTDPFKELGLEPEGRQDGADLRRAECPSCHKSLARVPGRKTHCPHCGLPVFVRTRAQDRARVVVNEAQAKRMELDWAVLGGAREPTFACLASKEDVLRIQEGMTRSLGREAQVDEIKRALLDEIAERHAKAEDWGLFRNTQLAIAELLLRRWQLRAALSSYIYVWILDANGASNGNSWKDEELQEKYPPFDITTAFEAPVIIQQIVGIVSVLNADKDDLRPLFEDAYSKHAFPLSLDECYSTIEQTLSREALSP
jgi:hypothetical protein